MRKSRLSAGANYPISLAKIAATQSPEADIMFFDNTTDPKTRAAIQRAHQERGKILREVLSWMLRKD